MDNFPFPACPLLIPARDLWPTISGYFIDHMDNLANKLTTGHYPKSCITLMKYWDKHKTDIFTIFECQYPRSDLPTWVIYDDFREDMIMKLWGAMIEQLVNDVNYMTKNNVHYNLTVIELSFEAGFALCSRHTDRESLYMRAEDYLRVTLEIDTGDLMKFCGKK